MSQLKCSSCFHGVEISIEDFVQVDERWCLVCGHCNHTLESISTTEFDQMLLGMQLTKQFVPGLINIHDYHDKNLPSRVKFGWIKKT
ncbi:MAG: hypothetical protein ACE3L7_30010 [Candidatus Pristimantibacillus sp.]